MKSSEDFKILLIVQIITLILVVIIFFNNLSVPETSTQSGVPFEQKILNKKTDSIGRK